VMINAQDEAAGLIDFRVRYGESPYLLALGVVVYAWAGLVFWSIAQLSRHYGSLSRRPVSRLGLAMSMAGGLLGVTNSIYTTGVMLARYFSIPTPFEEGVVENALVAGAILLLVLGESIHVWGAWLRLPAASEWLRSYRAYVAIFPLWADLCRAVPDVALIPPSNTLRDLAPPRDVAFRLYRRLIEVLDARLALRPFADVAIGEDEESGPGAMEAATLDSALRRRAAGEPPRRTQLKEIVNIGGDASEELAFFCEVARHRVRSRFLRVALERIAP
jgi:hypothetical protein